MISATKLIVLDTNVLVRLLRDDEAGRRIRADHALDTRTERPLISVITVGEIRALAELWGWGQAKKDCLGELLRQLVVVSVSQGDITQRYAALDHHNKKVMKPARPIGENDTWIAATAWATDAVLLTTDGDFEHLSPQFFGLVQVDAKTGRTLRES